MIRLTNNHVSGARLATRSSFSFPWPKSAPVCFDLLEAARPSANITQIKRRETFLLTRMMRFVQQESMRAELGHETLEAGRGYAVAGSRRVQVPEPRTRSWAEPGECLGSRDER